MFAAAATVPSLRFGIDAATAGEAAARDVAADQAGYGTDPDLQKEWKAGGPWPLTLTENARATTKALCDLIIPEDDVSPAASAVGVVDFIDEWISAPYPDQRADRESVVEGFAWIDAEANRRFSKSFVALAAAEISAICDDVAWLEIAKADFVEPAKFFARYRDLTAGGFYTTPVGRSDLRYVGNVPLPAFNGPPLEVLKKAGLA
jgi:hypothetical protein